MKTKIKLRYYLSIIALSMVGVFMYDALWADEEQTSSISKPGTCEVSSVSCSPNTANDYVRCTGTSSCKRNSAEGWVECDGNKTRCRN